MAAPVAIQLAGAMAISPGMGGSSPSNPKTPVSPTSSSQGFPVNRIPSPFVNMNVRDVFETRSLDYTTEISKRVNLEIEKKREELRTLVGERYRDLIDAADTIASMSTSSADIFGKLGTLRQQMSSLPIQLNYTSNTLSSGNNQHEVKSLNSEELEIAFELKLSLEAPRVVQKYLDEAKVIPATHILQLYTNYLSQANKPYRWAFLSTSGADPKDTAASIRNLILKTCDDMIEDFSTPAQKLAECIAAKQIVANVSCSDVLIELFNKRIQMSEQSLKDKSHTNFVENVANTLFDIHLIFIDGQLYSNAVKEMRRPKISLDPFGIKYSAKAINLFNQETILIEDAPRAGLLAQLIHDSYITSLKSLLQRCYEQKLYLTDQQTFLELSDYSKCTIHTLKAKTEELMRIVLGTSNSLWSEAFYPVFQQKCEQIGLHKTEAIFQYLDAEAYENFKKVDEDFDLVSYIWKAATISSLSSNTSSVNKDVDLKLKCISPQVADICLQIEERFVNFLKDFQSLGDFSLKKFISSKILEEWKHFLDNVSSKSSSLFLGRFVASLQDLCPTIWKLMDMKDGTELRASFASASENCWSSWSLQMTEKFGQNLASQLKTLDQWSVAVFMPVAEEYSPQGEEAVKPSVRVPLQLSHSLHSNVFSLCYNLSCVGPQSVPKRIRESLRQSIGSKVIELYKQMIDSCESPVTPQTALQLIFDIKFCQWFHLQLKEVADPLVKHLQSIIDPFDMDIVSPRLKINLKRFLFETHLTLGLLFSEESHSFIAQNFKTKMNMSFPISNPSLNSPLPLLPV